MSGQSDVNEFAAELARALHDRAVRRENADPGSAIQERVFPLVFASYDDGHAQAPVTGVLVDEDGDIVITVGQP